MPKKLTTPRERFLLAEVDRMVQVVARARDVSLMARRFATTPAAVIREVIELDKAIQRLDANSADPLRPEARNG